MTNKKTQELVETTGLELLRLPFPEKLISKLPKPTAKKEDMEKLPKAPCNVCGGYHATSKIIHLDYVGHAALTDRLLDVDPHWNWAPLALGSDGLPSIDKDGGMWITLTVLNMTRLGYGDAQGKTGANATKERIGDALRNAAMRFGAALDLWSKADLHGDDDKEPQEPENPTPKQETPPAPEAHTITNEQLKDGAAKIMAEINAAQDESAINATLKEHAAMIAEIKARAPKWWQHPEKGTGLLPAMNAKLDKINAFENERNSENPFDGEGV